MKKTSKHPLSRRPAARPRRWAGRDRPMRWLGWLWGLLLVLASALGQPAGAQGSGRAGTAAVFLKAVAGSPRAYVGQPVTVSYLLYHRVPIIDPDDEITLSFRNCLVEEYPSTQQEYQETVGGQRYKVLVLKKYVVVPQLAGSLPLPVLTRRYSVSSPPGADDFFGGPQLVSRSLHSPAGQLLVLPLPPPSDSVAFCGAVGQFQFRPICTVSKKADNMLTVQVQASGSGNLKGFRLVPPALPGGMDFFNVRSTEQHTLAEAGWQATSTYSYEVLASYRGTHTLPGIALAYFDPVAGRYVSFVGPAFRWAVTQGARAAPPKLAGRPRALAARRPALHTKTTLFEDQDNYLFLGSSAYYLLLLAAGTLFLAGIAYTHYVAAHAANGRHIRFRKAKSRAIRAIRNAEQLPVTETDRYYKALDTALTAYLGSKFGWPEQEGGWGNALANRMQGCELPAQLQTQTLACLRQLHKLRFAANGAAAHPRRSYGDELLTLICQLDACISEQPYTELVGAAE